MNNSLQAPVLLVDDNPVKLFALESMLTGLTLHLITVPSARDALQVLLNQEVAVILLDVNMPEMDGFELAELIRSHPRCAQTPIIFLSAVNTTEAYAFKGYSLGAVDYLADLNPVVIRAKVAVFVELFQKTRALRLLNAELEQRVQERTAALTQLNAVLQEEVARRAAMALENARLYREALEARDLLARQAEELSRSNAELQQFAYVASHDLQEPLRMVTTYVQLLAKRYEGALDARAEEFIGYAVEGAHRMKALIDDLLAYSRVGARTKPFAPVACEHVLTTTLQTLHLAITESQACIVHEPLPVIYGDELQVGLLFQNLLSNAVKFCNSQPPQVHIAVRRDGSQWRFAVQDNGIGVAPAYAEQIFALFQRLHTRAAYPGNGMGLAICKKIVEQHGGRIWVESAVGVGATFFFTLPAYEPEAHAK